MIKYQTLSLQVCNAGGLEQAIAYISFLMLQQGNPSLFLECYGSCGG